MPRPAGPAVQPDPALAETEAASRRRAFARRAEFVRRFDQRGLPPDSASSGRVVAPLSQRALRVRQSVPHSALHVASCHTSISHLVAVYLLNQLMRCYVNNVNTYKCKKYVNTYNIQRHLAIPV